MTNFLTRVEGKASDVERVSNDGKSLLVLVERDGQEVEEGEKARPSVVRHRNVLEEDSFQSDWPADSVLEDNRDVMHMRGWTFLRVHGQVNGRNVSGAGRIPFVYANSRRHSAWLKLRIGDATLTDSSSGAIVREGNGATVAAYHQGSFFKGLGRPWMGLHALDTVRRDAAEQRMLFETEVMDNGRDVQVTVSAEGTTLVYTIDLEADLVREIALLQGGRLVGNLAFEYLQEIDENDREFRAPDGTDGRTSLRPSQGILWLVQLAEGAFNQ